MDLDTMIIVIFCRIDDHLCEVRPRLRGRGPAPLLSDSEVLTIEVVGELLGLETDKAVFSYFRRHYSDLFPALGCVHRTTYVRQSSNLMSIKEQLWRRLLPAESGAGVVDSFPVSVCRFGRSKKSRLFRGFADYGKDHLGKATIFGFRFHVRIDIHGWITRLAVAPANVPDTAVLPQLAEKTSGCLLGDRNYWQPHLHEEFGEQGLDICAPFRMKSKDRDPERGRLIARNRQLIETVFSQLTCRFHIKRVWARDRWHLANRVVRKVLAHTIGVRLNLEQGCRPLQFAKLFAD